MSETSENTSNSNTKLRAERPAGCNGYAGPVHVVEGLNFLRTHA